MSVAWPAALPMPQFGLRYNVVDPQRRTQMASGRDMVRRRFSDVPTEFPARWMLTAAEAELFEQFYQDDLVDGSEWIEMPLVTAQGEGVHFVRFRGAYSYRRVGDDLWEYSAEMQMYLRPASIEEPPIIGGDPGPGPDPDPDPVWYLRFLGNGEFSLRTAANIKGWDGTLEYSTDTESWATWSGTAAINSSGSVLYLRGSGNTYVSRATGSDWKFSGSATQIACEGNIETLLDWGTVRDGGHPTMAFSCYYRLFKDCTSLMSAPSLPATALAASCYNEMFSGCSSLISAPELPAATLAVACYMNMFFGCTSLISAPLLPATALSGQCYYQMFRGCTLITSAPVLPATTLATYCYYYMFADCASLISAPILPATTLATYCYSYMFYNCESLKVSASASGVYVYQWRIPASGTIGSTPSNWNTGMLQNTGGTFTSNPSINTAYWTEYAPV